MKKIITIAITIIASLILFSCGGDLKTSNVTPAVPVVDGLKLQWNEFTINTDGSPALVDGYKITCSDASGNNVQVDVLGQSTTEYPLNNIPVGNGNWCCGVQAYNNQNNVLTVTNMSDMACFDKNGHSYTY